MKIKVLVCDSISEAGLAPLKKDARFTFVQKGKLDSEEINALIGDFDAVLLRSGTKIKRENLKKTEKLKIIARAGVGIDNIDIEAASEKGILIINAPSGNTIAACEHTIALIMCLARKIPQANQSTKSGAWDKKSFIGTELAGKTAGIIGLGKIGAEVAKRLTSFEMNIIAYDPFVKQEDVTDLGIKMVQLDELFEKSDVVTMHVPKNKHTLNMLNMEALKKMKKTAMLVNCSRGGVVNEDDLLKALSSGIINSAALDVFDKEPLERDDLRKPDNLIITPHLGASTLEAQDKVALSVAEDILRFFDGEIPESACNFSSVKGAEGELKPFLTLAEKLGSAASQISGSLDNLKFIYGERAMKLNLNAVKSAFLKGLLSQILDEKVNLISALPIARKRNILWDDFENPKEKFVDALGIETADLSLKGRVAADGARFFECNGFECDIKVGGNELILSNEDIPGIIGKVGTILGNANVNIASMDVARNKKGGRALTIIKLDEKPLPETLAEIEKIKGISSIKLIFIA